LSTYDQRRSIAEARPFATFAVEEFTKRGLTAVTMGSYRRYAARDEGPGSVGDIDLLVTTSASGPIDLTQYDLPPWLTVTEKKANGWLTFEVRMKIDAWACPTESVGPFALFLTGPPDLNVWMRKRATMVGLMLSQYGLFVPVPKPTKTKPDRVVAGERVDVPPVDDGIVVKEQAFWETFCEKTNTVMDFPWPSDRDDWRDHARGY
jgi:DNA polymerase/3'-5' exonuclease PolX